jgi:hypothetical protein
LNLGVNTSNGTGKFVVFAAKNKQVGLNVSFTTL